MRVWEPFDRFEFPDRWGRIREVAGCSITGIFEFQDRMAELWQIIEDSPDKEAWITLYEWDKRFRFLIDRCLELNGVDPDWVTPTMIQQLLFERTIEGESHPGWLIEINMAAGDNTQVRKKASLAEMLAKISTFTNNDVGKAQELAEQLPAKDLEAILSELNELQKAIADPEKSKIKQQQAKSKEFLEKRRQQMGVPSG